MKLTTSPHLAHQVLNGILAMVSTELVWITNCAIFGVDILTQFTNIYKVSFIYGDLFSAPGIDDSDIPLSRASPI